MKAIKQTLLALALASTFTTANATPVDWTLNNVTLTVYSPSGSSYDVNLYGSFTYDAGTNTYSNEIISVFPEGTSEYNSSTTWMNTGDANSFTFYFTYYISAGVVTGFAWLNFADALSNAGGVISLAGGEYSSIAYSFVGTVTGVPQASAVPEPEAYAMMLAGLGLVGFAARRKLS